MTEERVDETVTQPEGSSVELTTDTHSPADTSAKSHEEVTSSPQGNNKACFIV